MAKLVYVCEGGDCSEKGSVELFEKLKARFHEHDPKEERFKIRKYPCFGGCECGINITIWPDRVFLSKVTDADLPEIVDQVEHEKEPIKRLTGHVKPDVEEFIWEMLDSPF